MRVVIIWVMLSIHESSCSFIVDIACQLINAVCLDVLIGLLERSVILLLVKQFFF